MKKILLIIMCLIFISGCKNNNQDNINEPSETNSISLTLEGEETIYLENNNSYEEPGYKATDSLGNDVTSLVKIDGEVLKSPGEYTLTYQLNIDDLSITKTRKVIIKKLEVETNASSIPVLMYHYFYDDTAGEQAINTNYLAKTKFIEQLEYLKNNNYYFPTMTELSQYLNGEIKLPEKSIILTMDDGAESNYRIAYPLALEYQIPLVWFVVTSWTDPSLPYQQEVINSGYVSMESHTHDMHKPGCSEGHGGYFLCISKEDGLKDMETSKELLKTAISVAYPFGDYNDSTKEIVKASGFKLAFTTEWGKVKPGMDPYSLPRVRISDSMNLQSFISAIS